MHVSGSNSSIGIKKLATMHSKCSILFLIVHTAVFAVPGSEKHIKTRAAMQPRAR